MAESTALPVLPAPRSIDAVGDDLLTMFPADGSLPAAGATGSDFAGKGGDVEAGRALLEADDDAAGGGSGAKSADSAAGESKAPKSADSDDEEELDFGLDADSSLDETDDSAAGLVSASIQPYVYSDMPVRRVTDPAFGGLFLLHLALVLLLGLWSSRSADSTTFLLVHHSPFPLRTYFLSGVLITVTMSVPLLLGLLSPLKERLVIALPLLSVAVLALLDLEFIFSRMGHLATVVIVLLTVILQLLWLVRNRDKLSLARVMIEVVSAVLRFDRWVLLLVLVMLGIASAWLLVWTLAAAEVLRSGGAVITPLLLLFLLGSLYWSSSLVCNMVHAAITGAVSDWYFQETQQIVQRTRVTFFLRVLSMQSFGSMCLGSLLSPPATLLWSCERLLRRVQGLPFALTLLMAMEGSPRLQAFIRSHHAFAWTHVAVHGKSYRAAARAVWEQMQQRGLESLLDDDITQSIVHFACCSVGGFLALVHGLLSASSLHWAGWMFVIIVAFLTGFLLTNITLQPISATVAALFVCFAEQPQRLSARFPILYHRFLRVSEYDVYRSRYLSASA
eukprot:PLAT9185.1.p1 GENE.PLAT9185.1~~PLAT9185.1.p1  ORF type:complete len:562 (+),score=290.73 PLAT9185.1:69-1754(+)